MINRRSLLQKVIGMMPGSFLVLAGFSSNPAEAAIQAPAMPIWSDMRYDYNTGTYSFIAYAMINGKRYTLKRKYRIKSLDFCIKSGKIHFELIEVPKDNLR